MSSGVAAGGRGRPTVVVVGHGMVGHRLVQSLMERGITATTDIVVIGTEVHHAYDRVHLSSLFEGTSAAELALGDLTAAGDPAVTLRRDETVVALDREARTVTTDRKRTIAYDTLVLAAGSAPFVPPVPGRDLPGCFVYRTLDDVDAIRDRAGQGTGSGQGQGQGSPGEGGRAVVVGGGLLGLEAANALRACGLETDIVELAPRLMPLQVDETGGAVLRHRIEQLGLRVHVSTSVVAVEAGPDGEVAAVTIRSATGDADRIPARMVVFAAGIRPNDGLARAAGLEVGERGGVVVDDRCRTADPAVYAIGECASVAGTVHGLVSPGYQMARVVADVLSGTDAAFTGADASAKLKLLGVDVASFGDAHATGPDAATVSYTDHAGAVHKRLVVDGAGRLTGGVLVGDATGYDLLTAMARGDVPTPAEVGPLIAPSGGGAPVAVGVDALPDAAGVCSCENVTKGALCSAVADCLAETGTADVGALKARTRAGTGCGGCGPLLADLVRAELGRAGVAVNDHLCEHFPHSRQELFDIVRLERITTFAGLLSRAGTGRGCEICKPAVASILASLGHGYILDGDQAGLQDTNDHFLANLQRDGTYSVVPRVPGGEITPEKLIVLGEVAREFSLYTKITGGQRIDLFGARVEQLPAIWARLVAAGFESGHAYGKALRTVKSCVGTTWCRYGVQDSTTLAIDLELRYRGLRSPHKIKLGVSGCARECAEAQAKDVGIIATERGWNLWVGGNGGTRPRHAQLLAEDLDTEALTRAIDRFLMFYIRTAGRLQRTASWVEQLDGGVDYLRRVIFDDVLGVGADLDAAMAAHVADYRCEWAETLGDPERVRRFRTFLNSDAPDPDIVMVTERDQPRPDPEWQQVALARSRS